MKAILRTCFLWLIVITGNTALFAQSGIDTLLIHYQKDDAREKIYVHFDKSMYNPGETIWFKAYLFAGTLRSEISKNFYAELRNDSGVLINKITAPILFSGAYSQFDIPESYSKTKLIFRAYTVAMLNGDTNFIYTKSIRVLNPEKRIAGAKAPQPEFALLPEGGDLVEGLNSVVAFKAALPDGKPVHIKGYLKTNDGNKLADFASIHNGMGTFNLMPIAGVSYTAVWKDESGKERTMLLPPAKSQGVVLHIKDKFDMPGTPATAKEFTIQRSENVPESLQHLSIVGVMNRELVYEARINMTAKLSVTASMPTTEFPTGILQITIFDRDMKPVAERVCYVNNAGFEFDADAWISELNVEKRSLNRAEVKISDDLPVNMSLSITDADLNVPPVNDDNIVSRTLLTGDLRGNIYQPYYYFFSTSDSVPAHLDLVMLTNGWRRYNWDRVFHPDPAASRYIENNYLAIQGKIVGQGNFAEGMQLNGFLRTQDSTSTFVSLPIDRNGFVKQDDFIFYDSAKLYVNYSDKKRDFDPSTFNASNGLLQAGVGYGLKNSLAQLGYQPDSLLVLRNLKNNKEALKVAAKQYKDAHELGNVTVTAKAKSDLQKMDERYAKGIFSGGNATSFDVANDPFAAASYSVFQYLQGKVAGLQIMGGGPTPSLTWRGGTPGLYLDEMQTDASAISGISMADVAYIKVFNPGSSAIFSNGGSGVIAVYTKRGGDMNSTVDSRLGLIRLSGYSPVKEFYAPSYATPSPDDYYDNLRTTLYWDPLIVLDKNKKRYKIQFYNNDITKRFRIVLEGINADGKLVHVEKIASKD